MADTSRPVMPGSLMRPLDTAVLHAIGSSTRSMRTVVYASWSPSAVHSFAAGTAGGLSGCVGDGVDRQPVAQLFGHQAHDERLGGLGGLRLHPREVLGAWRAVVLGQQPADELGGIQVRLLGGVAGDASLRAARCDPLTARSRAMSVGSGSAGGAGASGCAAGPRRRRRRRLSCRGCGSHASAGVVDGRTAVRQPTTAADRRADDDDRDQRTGGGLSSLMSLDRGAGSAEEGDQRVGRADQHRRPAETRTPVLPRPATCGLEEWEPIAQAIAEMAMPATAAMRPKVSRAPTIFSMRGDAGQAVLVGRDVD